MIEESYSEGFEGRDSGGHDVGETEILRRKGRTVTRGHKDCPVLPQRRLLEHCLSLAEPDSRDLHRVQGSKLVSNHQAPSRH